MKESKSLLTQLFGVVVAKIITFKMILIGLVMLLVIFFVSLIASIPFVGDSLSAEFTSKNDELAGIGMFDESKLPRYIETEKDSYPNNLSAMHLNEKESWILENTGSEKSYKYLDSPSENYSTHASNAEQYTEKHRLWWQGLAAFDITAVSQDKISMITVNSVKDQLSPIFTNPYTIHGDLVLNSDINEYQYVKTIVTTTKYKNGSQTSNKIKQTNEKTTIPVPAPTEVKTMFFDFSYDYDLVETSNEITQNTSESTYTREVPAYDPATATVTTVTDHYKTITKTSVQTVYFANNIMETKSKNTRYTDYFLNNKKENNQSYQETEPLSLIEMAQYFREGYDFAQNGYEYLDKIPSYSYIQGAVYSGATSGNYQVTDDVLDYGFPIEMDINGTGQVRVTSTFGPRISTTPGTYSSGFHSGLDFGIPSGTPLKAVKSGIVETSTYDAYAGYYIKIKHDDGTYSRYLHNSSLLVRVGNEVNRGDIISLSGNTGRSTGPHLHFEIRNTSDEAVDPMLYLPLERTN